MNELKCSVCNSTDFYGPSVFDEQLLTKISLRSDIPHENYCLAYKRKMMCKNCGNIIEIPNEVTLNLHKLAQFLEVSK